MRAVAPAAEPCGQAQLSKQLNGALQRAQSTRQPERSASASDLLERCEEKPVVSQHLRTRSSPVGDKLVQVSDWRRDDVSLTQVSASTRSPSLCVAGPVRRYRADGVFFLGLSPVPEAEKAQSWEFRLTESGVQGGQLVCAVPLIEVNMRS